MKKLICMLLVMSCLCIAFFACGKKAQTGGTSGSTTDNTSSGSRETANTSSSSSSTVTQSSSSEQAENPVLALLVGSWESVRREGNYLSTISVTFYEDGTGMMFGQSYANVYFDPFEDAGEYFDGWYVEPMGYPCDFFTYTLEGSTLQITFLENDCEDYADFTETHTVLELTQERLELTDDAYGVYVRLEDSTLKGLCEALGVDYTIYKDDSDISPQAIVGRWATVTRGGNSLRYNSFDFNEDGTGSTYHCNYDCFDLNTGEKLDHWVTSGGAIWFDIYFTYEINGNQLILYYEDMPEYGWENVVETYTISRLDEEYFIIDDRYGTYIPSCGLEELCERLGVDYTIYSEENTDYAKMIVGQWATVVRKDWEEEPELDYNSFTFNEDGTGSEYHCVYTYYDWSNEGEKLDHWVTHAGGTWISFGFTYEIKGDQLIIYYEDMPEYGWENVVRTYTISRLDEEYFIIDDDYGTYIPSCGLEELCERLGVDYTIYD